MKHLVIITQFLILIISCGNTKLSVAQKSEEEVKDKIAAYYKLVNQAELLVIKKDYFKAIDYYLLADQKHSLFIRDVQNILTSCIEIKNYTIAVRFAKKLLKKGVPYAYFENKYLFKDFIKTEAWLLLKEERVKSKINLELKVKIDSLLERDQEFRHDYDYYIDTIIAIDTLIKNEILDIFDTYGYPNTDVIGVPMYNDTTLRRGWTSFDVLLIHQIKNNRESFIPILEKFLYSGQMHNKSFMSHSKNFHPLDQYKLSCMESVQGLFIQVKDELFTCCCKEEVKIDSLRKKYYLETLEELKLKAAFHYEIDQRFSFGGCALKYDSESEESALKTKTMLLEKGFVLYKKLNSEKPYYKR